MAIQIGVVKVVIGEVTATSVEGAGRLLQAGDQAYADDLISSGPHSAIEICFADGGLMDLGANSQVMLTDEFFYPQATTMADTDGDDVLSALASTSFLINEQGDDILTGHVSDDLSAAGNEDSIAASTVADDDDVVDMADVLSGASSQISGVEYEGHLQIQVSNTEGIVHLINLTNVAAVDDIAAQMALDHLLNPGNGDEII